MNRKDKERLNWQGYEEEKPEDLLRLLPCPWCKQIPIWVETNWGTEVHCSNHNCDARPQIGYDKGKSKEEISYVWNSLYDTIPQQKKMVYRDKLSYGQPSEGSTDKKQNEGARKDFAARYKEGIDEK